jgi:hypothetical protein
MTPPHPLIEYTKRLAFLSLKLTSSAFRQEHRWVYSRLSISDLHVISIGAAELTAATLPDRKRDLTRQITVNTLRSEISLC